MATPPRRYRSQRPSPTTTAHAIFNVVRMYAGVCIQFLAVLCACIAVLIVVNHKADSFLTVLGVALGLMIASAGLWGLGRISKRRDVRAVPVYGVIGLLLTTPGIAFLLTSPKALDSSNPFPPLVIFIGSCFALGMSLRTTALVQPTPPITAHHN